MKPLARARLVAAVTVAALCSPAVLPTATATPAPEPTAAAFGASVSHTVTLITGDRVTVTTTPDGRKSYSAVPRRIPPRARFWPVRTSTATRTSTRAM